jgi:spermidine synthase
MIISSMLFAMGLGSRFSKNISGNLILKFILIEFLLSILVASSALASYALAAYTDYIGVVIYALAIAIGFLIGLEIPLVIRVNNEFEELKINISAVLEKDYYGSLAGGLFFSFVGLPFLGLTYIPIVLGAANFIVSFLILFIVYRNLTANRKIVILFAAITSAIVISATTFYSDRIIQFAEQSKYSDKIVYSEQSKYQKIVITQWKDDFWLFINGNQQLSSYDEELYHEPIVHIPAYLTGNLKNILIFGGGDGCAARELLKYQSINQIKLVDLDPAMTNLGKNHPIMTAINDSAFHSPKVKIYNEDAFTYAEREKSRFDLIIIDLPDPKTPDLSRLYSKEFYMLCKNILKGDGILITQAGSPYYAPKAFYAIEKTLQTANFHTLKLHNQILTLGEWGWIIGSPNLKKEEMKIRLDNANFKNIDTKFIDNSAVKMMTNFGKKFYFKDTNIEINTLNNPFLYQYYLDGDWKLY